MDFLLEVGTEELPADFVASAIAQLRERVSKSLETESLGATNIQVYGTPRRLAVLITGLPRQQQDRTEEIKGPPASAVYKDGKITPQEKVSPENRELQSILSQFGLRIREILSLLRKRFSAVKLRRF